VQKFIRANICHTVDNPPICDGQMFFQSTCGNNWQFAEFSSSCWVTIHGNNARFMQPIFISTSTNIGHQSTMYKLLYTWTATPDIPKSYRICFQNTVIIQYIGYCEARLYGAL